MSENMIKMMEVLQRESGDLTTAIVAEKSGLTARQVVALFNACVRKGYGFREELNGVKYLRLTETGKNLNLMKVNE